MVNLKQIGGIILLACAGLMITTVIVALIQQYYGPSYVLHMVISILYGIVILLGGILALKGKTIGGVLALILGVLWLSTAILMNVGVYPTADWVLFIMHMPWSSLFYHFVDITVWGYLFIETLVILVGAILVVIGSAD